MKTIRLTWIALSMAALLVAAIAPAASAACVSGSGSAACLKGTYTFRLDGATGFDANLAPFPGNAGCTGPGTPFVCCTGPTTGTCLSPDPGNVYLAGRQNVTQAGQFTVNGSGGVTGGETFATTDDQLGNTHLIDFDWAGTYAVNADLTGTLTITPGPVSSTASSWKCYDMTSFGNQPDWAPNTYYYGAPNAAPPLWPPAQIRPSLSNAGNSVYQVVAPPTWTKSTTYRSSFEIQNNGYAYQSTAPSAWAPGTFYAAGYEILPTNASTAANTYCTAIGTPYYCCTGSGTGYCSTVNPGHYVYSASGLGVSGSTVPPLFDQTTGSTTWDNGVLWTNLGQIRLTSGSSAPSWKTGAALALASNNPNSFTVDGGIMWVLEGPVGYSGGTEPTWSQVGQATNDGGITWVSVGTAPLTPIACTAEPTEAETYSISLSATHGAAEMVETGNSTGPGAKIFMTGEAVKR